MDFLKSGFDLQEEVVDIPAFIVRSLDCLNLAARVRSFPVRWNGEDSPAQCAALRYRLS